VVDSFEIDPELREALLEPFIQATCLTLREMANVEAAPRASQRTSACRTCGDISAVLPLTSRAQSALVLSFPQQTAAHLAGRILAEVTPDVDAAMVRDCAGELANVIGGQAKALLHGTSYQFAFSTPTILTGSEQDVCPGEDGGCLVAMFDSEVGDFTLQVCLKP
jgi:chemotaxis protein CheX